MKKKINLTIIFVGNRLDGYTAFFKERPNIIAEGDTKREAKENLLRLTNEVIKHQNK